MFSVGTDERTCGKADKAAVKLLRIAYYRDYNDENSYFSLYCNKDISTRIRSPTAGGTIVAST